MLFGLFPLTKRCSIVLFVKVFCLSANLPLYEKEWVEQKSQNVFCFLHVHFFSFVLCGQKKRNEPKKRKPAPVKKAFKIQKRKFQVTRTCKFSFLHLKISNPFHIRTPPRTPFIIISQAFPHFIRSAPHGIRCLGLPAFARSVVLAHMGRSLISFGQPRTESAKKSPDTFAPGKLPSPIIVNKSIKNLISLTNRQSSLMPKTVSCLPEPTELMKFAVRSAVLYIQRILLQYQRP